MPRPPAAVTSSAVSSMVSGRPDDAGVARVLRPVQYTVAPASPSIRAMPRPAPRVAPATTVIFPVRVEDMQRSLRHQARVRIVPVGQLRLAGEIAVPVGRKGACRSEVDETLEIAHQVRLIEIPSTHGYVAPARSRSSGGYRCCGAEAHKPAKLFRRPADLGLKSPRKLSAGHLKFARKTTDGP